MFDNHCRYFVPLSSLFVDKQWFNLLCLFDSNYYDVDVKYINEKQYYIYVCCDFSHSLRGNCDAIVRWKSDGRPHSQGIPSSLQPLITKTITKKKKSDQQQSESCLTRRLNAHEG